MTAFSSPCSKNAPEAAARARRALFAGLVALVLLLVPGTAPAGADEIAVRDARLEAGEEGYSLVADFELELPAKIADLLASSVPVYFLVEFELTRSRWYWFAERTASRRLLIRLSYHPLSRQYRVSTGPLQRSFPTLGEALGAVARVRAWQVLERGAVTPDTPYDAAVRMRFDSSQLPRPLQIGVFGARELQLESPWRRFVWRPPAIVPAETRADPPARAEGAR